ncbi:MAG: phage terminase small subunit P27 family [Archangium sp.]
MSRGNRGGRRPLPRETKIARGTLRSDRDDPQSLAACDTPIDDAELAAPEWLEPDALAEWRRVVPELRRVLTPRDLTLLAHYCASVGLAVKASKQLKRQGLTTKRANGSVCANPLIAIAKEARAQSLRFAVEFGITPAARTRVNVNDADGDDGDSDPSAAEFLFAKPLPPPAPSLQLVHTTPKANDAASDAAPSTPN